MSHTQSDAATNREYVDDRDLAADGGRDRLTPFSRAQFATWRREGGGPPWRKVGRRCIYFWPEVKAWIDAQKVGAK